MQARSAVVDLFGDHLRRRGWWAPVSAILTLTGTVEVGAPATRTAISRLAAQGWLEPRTDTGLRGYAASARARDRWHRAHDRIYAGSPAPWDGRWHMVHVDSGGDRRRREQVAATLTYLGYGRLGGGGWVSPRPSPELADSLGPLEVGWVAVHGALDPAQDGSVLASRVWDLEELAAAHRRFEAGLPGVEEAARTGPEQSYRARTLLVHEWRRFLFRDPELPPQVLPPDWPGQRARARFLELARALAPAADHYVDDVLASATR
ncbi:Phenylacetic acid degradation operon negative regulatory protein paaX [Serinicoccus hydrothermalis]|uniref:Phenylacetic acid degradation operon negative regulatory protein paaX n=1 Tax=Serinicoccus hydrothermalis TaxID=1758689 RepID=A0A1B1NG58_9MICO|nr:PaaX family transcriptional regulator C-terminal domain-containing protein [Serinicoccus hydrothermalis]ANS80397.1 Phenylacetic acid degradation operon negative regulatory protein paaX [Serinicoccus hydrothermalis]